MILAARCGQVEIVECLLEAGANINLRDAQAETALLRAIACGHDQVAEVPITAGADISCNSNRALYIAVDTA